MTYSSTKVDPLDWLCSERYADSSACKPVLLAAHPDDETIGAGSRLPLFRNGWIVHLTNGAPRDVSFSNAAGFERPEDYAVARRRELLAVARNVGVASERWAELHAVDQEAIHEVSRLSKEFKKMLDEWNPDFVLTHPYEGGHPDHDTAALLVSLCNGFRIEEGKAAIPVIEMTSYHAQKGQAGRLTTQTFLPNGASAERELVLSAEQIANKQVLLDCFKTQQVILQNFGVEIERFRRAPAYDFRKPPHEGVLYYETLGWPIDGKQWRKCAEAAMVSASLHECCVC